MSEIIKEQFYVYITTCMDWPPARVTYSSALMRWYVPRYSTSAMLRPWILKSIKIGLSLKFFLHPYRLTPMKWVMELDIEGCPLYSQLVPTSSVGTNKLGWFQPFTMPTVGTNPRMNYICFNHNIYWKMSIMYDMVIWTDGCIVAVKWVVPHEWDFQEKEVRVDRLSE